MASVECHKDYKSLVPELPQAKDIEAIINIREWFSRTELGYFHVPPSERGLYKQVSLNFRPNIRFDYKDIDRVYYLKYEEGDRDDRYLVWAFRMLLFGEPTYIEFTLQWCACCSFRRRTILDTLFSRNPTTFFNIIITPEWDLGKLVEFLSLDGIYIHFSSALKHNSVRVPSLQSLCCIPLYAGMDLIDYKYDGTGPDGSWPLKIPKCVGAFADASLKCLDSRKKLSLNPYYRQKRRNLCHIVRLISIGRFPF